MAATLSTKRHTEQSICGIMESRMIRDNTFGDNTRIHQGDVIYQQAADVSQERSLDLLDSLPEASFDAANKQHVPRCLPNTRREVLTQIRKWADGEGQSRIYWLKGMAGTGKSTIALTVAREYSEKKRLGASFFFSRDGGDLASTQRFVATIAVQLSEQTAELRGLIADAAASHRRTRGLGLYDQWERLVLQPLSQLGKNALSHPLIIVLDALDECDNGDDVSLMIRCLAAAVSIEHVNLRIFVTSRPDQPIVFGFDGISADAHQDFILHDIEQSIVDEDLELYCRHELSRLAQSSRLDMAFLSDDTIPNLVRRSCGLFIYAATVCRFVREGGPLAGDRLSRLNSAERLPPRAETELDTMYTTVLAYVLKTESVRFDPEEMERIQGLFRRIVGAIVVLFDALSPASLSMMLAESEETISSTLRGLHSLVDVPEKSEGPIRLLHPSFREFLTDPRRCSNTIFRIDPKKAHGHLFESCLMVMSHHLRKNMCNIQKSGTRVHEIARSDVDKAIPFPVQYACRYWVYHLQRSDVDPREHPGLIDFFHTRFLFWLEALSLFSRIADGIAMVGLLEDIIQRRITTVRRGLLGKITATLARKQANRPAPLNAVVYDAKRFLLSHSSIIEEAPLQTYSSSLIFSPETSIIRRLYKQYIPKWVVRVPTVPRNWSIHLQTLRSPSQVNAVAFSPDGRLIASGSWDATVRIWDAATGAERRELRGHLGWIMSVAFSPDSRLIISGSEDHTIGIWDAATGAKRHLLDGHSGSVSAVSFSPDGSLIVSGSWDQTIRIWDTATGAQLRMLRGPLSEIYTVAFSPDGQSIVSGSIDNVVQIWDVALTTEFLTLNGHFASIRAVAFSPDGRLLISGSEDTTIRVWDAVTSTEQRVLKGHINTVNAVAFSPDGCLIVSGSEDRTIRIWDTATGAEQRVLRGPSDEVCAVAFSPDGRLIMSGAWDHTIRIWDAAMGRERYMHKGHVIPARAIAVSPDGQLIALGRRDIRIWDAATGTERRVLRGHPADVTTVAFSPDSQLIASGSFDNTIQIWSAVTGASRRVLKGHSKVVMAVAFSPNARLVVSSSLDDTIRVWDAGMGIELHSHVFKSSSNPSAVAFSPDGRWIALGSFDIVVRTWDDTESVEQYVLQGSSCAINGVAFSPDGQLIASSDYDGTISVWDTTTRAVLHVLRLDARLRHLSFASCGKHMVTDRGILPLPSCDCRCLPSIFATRSWITHGGEDLLYLHPDYRESFQAITGRGIACTGSISTNLQLDLLDVCK